MPGSSTIDRFVEKPKEFVGNRINAGIYIFNPSILDRIDVSSSFSPPLVLTDASHTQAKPTSIESETFPAMVADHQLHAMELHGFWADIGQPKDYLAGTCLYLTYLTSQKSALLSDPASNPWVFGGNVLVDPTAIVDPTAVIGPNVVIGPGVVVGKGVRLQRCVIMENARVRDHAWIQSSIVGWNSNVGRWVR
jgi:mannose-1-phosphate guanylyltransferase